VVRHPFYPWIPRLATAGARTSARPSTVFRGPHHHTRVSLPRLTRAIDDPQRRSVASPRGTRLAHLKQATRLSHRGARGDSDVAQSVICMAAQVIHGNHPASVIQCGTHAADTRSDSDIRRTDLASAIVQGHVESGSHRVAATTLQHQWP
jgi:hypothetical protein